MKPARPLVVIALLASFAVAFETDYSMSEYQALEEPQFFITPTLLDIGIGGNRGVVGRILSLDLQWWRMRAGISLGELGYGSHTTFLNMPVRAGFTIWQRPVRYTGRLYGMVPEIYVQGSYAIGIWSIDPPPTDLSISHAEARAAVDFYGVGIDVGIGAAAVKTRWGSSGQSWTDQWAVVPTLDARVRLAVGNFGL